jgi:HAL2 family 3'(2'),5'-bisphosphate nucleotidase
VPVSSAKHFENISFNRISKDSVLDISDPELSFAIQAVVHAAEVTRRVQSDLAAEKITKEDLSPVTVADFAAQAVVSRMLLSSFPGAVLVGEEDAADLRTTDGAAVLDAVTRYVETQAPDCGSTAVCDWIDHGNGTPSDRFWTLDPIDGTKGYLRGEQYAIALALIEDGQVKLGVLGCPKLGAGCSLDSQEGALALAVRGAGSWCGPLTASPALERLRVSTCDTMPHARMMRSVESGHTNTGQIGELVDLLALDSSPVCLDSQAKYAVLAAGGGEILLRLLSSSKPDYKEKIWDQAAGSIVLEEAGGRITDLSGRVLDFSQGTTLAGNSGVCATNGVLHDGVLEALARL